jgi:DegV family protein with EDD domain
MEVGLIRGFMKGGLMGIKIVTDTTAGLPPSWTEAHGVHVLPQFVIFDEISYRDDTELDTAEFLHKLRTQSGLPKTAAPPPALYHPIFSRLLSEGHEILVLAPSADVSGTLRSAETAAQEFPKGKIHVYDTRTVAAPFATMVMLAEQWAAQGMSVEEILARLKKLLERQEVYFVVATLEYLRRGGRIGGAKALIGGILQVKPILTLRDGHVEPFEQQRTQKRAISRVVELVLERCPPRTECYLSVMHAGAEDEAQEMAARFREALALKEVPIYLLPPAIVVHSGPGVLGVSFFRPED